MFPGTPRTLSSGEYTAMTANARKPITTSVPLTRAAAVNPTSAPPNAHASAVPCDNRPAASGRVPAGRLSRSAALSNKSLSAFPAAPSPIPESAAQPRSAVQSSAWAAIQPPATTPAEASKRFGNRIRRRTSVTQDVLVELLVARDDPLGGEFLGALHGARPHAGV